MEIEISYHVSRTAYVSLIYFCVHFFIYLLTIFPLIGAPGAYLILKLYGAGLIWKARLNRGRHLFQNQRSYSHEILQLSNFSFPNNNKDLPLRYIALHIPEILVFQYFLGNILVYIRLDFGQIFNKPFIFDALIRVKRFDGSTYSKLSFNSTVFIRRWRLFEACSLLEEIRYLYIYYQIILNHVNKKHAINYSLDLGQSIQEKTK